MRGLTIFIVMCCLHLTMDGQSITDVRYWFNQNDAEAVTESLTSSPWQDAVDVTALSEGWHVVHYAFQDDLGQWSSVESSRFRKRNSSANEVSAVTYWFNQDDSAPVTTPVIANTWMNALDISALSIGWHRIHFYFHDARGQKSSATSARFRIDQMAGNELILAEYWFDEDDASPESTTLSGQAVTFSGDISSSGVSTGWHLVNLRFKDERGQPSSVITSRAHIVDGEENALLLAKFWFDDCDAEDQFIYEYQSPNPEIVFFTCTCISPCVEVVGDHTMNVQFQDIRGAWGSVLTETLFFNNAPCDSDCRADINGDGVVDIQDFIELNSAFGTSCIDCPADINDDGDVNIDDFITFNSSYGKICDYAFEGVAPILATTKDLLEEIGSRPDIILHDEISKLMYSETTIQMHAYPNPSGPHEIFVRLTDLQDAPLGDVRILDVQGKVILHRGYEIQGKDALLRIEFPRPLAQGQYVINLLTSKGRVSSEFIVE